MLNEDGVTVVEGEVLATEDETALAIASNPYLPDAVGGTGKERHQWTDPLKVKFCQAIAEGASTSKAAHALEMSRSGVYYQRTIDPLFAAAWKEALELAADMYEDRLHDLAVGDRNPASVIFQLKNRRPDQWRDRHEVETTVKHEVAFSVTELPIERQRALAEMLLKTLPPKENTDAARLDAARDGG